MTGWLNKVLSAVMALACSAVARADDVAAQIQQYAGEHRLVVLGEYHGTREIPLLLLELAERYSRNGRPLQLALEMPRSDNLHLSAYLASDGRDADRRQLRSRPFWQVANDQHDGRRSRDMLQLIEGVRALRAQGRDVQVFGYDIERSLDSNQARDDALAAYLSQRFSKLPPAGRMLVLTGNVHAMRQLPARAPAEMQKRPMAMQLAELDLYSVRLEALRGTFWACTSRCAAVALRREAKALAPRASTAEKRQYDLTIWLPQLSVGQLTDR